MKKNLVFSALALLALWAAWGIAYVTVRNEYLLPSVGETFTAMGRLLTEAAFWRAFANTFLRTLWAFLLSALFGVGLALAARAFAPLRAFLAPVVSVLRTVPTMAVILILLLWTNALVAPVLVAFFVLMPALYSAALAAFDETADAYGGLVQAFGVGRGRALLKLYLPLSAPPLIKQAGSVLSMGLKITVSGEVLAQTFRSLGGMMQLAQIALDIPRLLALTVLTVLLGFLLESVCALACKFFVRWRT